MRSQILEWAKLYCNNPSLIDDGAFSYVLDQLEEAMLRLDVTSESLSDMSQAFGNVEGLNTKSLLAPFRRAKIW